jgi:hypothetical protein
MLKHFKYYESLNLRIYPRHPSEDQHQSIDMTDETLKFPGVGPGDRRRGKSPACSITLVSNINQSSQAPPPRDRRSTTLQGRPK